MAVSRRSRKQRPPRWAAWLQARVGSGSASPPPGRTDSPGQHTISFASLAWGALCRLADAPMLPGWDAARRGHWAQLRRDPRPPQQADERRPKPRAGVRPGLVRLVALGHLPAALFLRWLSPGRLTGLQDCEAAPHAWWRRAGHAAPSPAVGSGSKALA